MAEDESKSVKRLMMERTTLVDGLLSVLERKVTDAQTELLRVTIEGFVDKLELTEGGRIRNTLYNKRLLASIDTIFDKFGRSMGVEIAKTIAQGVQQVVNFSGEYFKTFTTKAKLLAILPQVQETVSAWLGVTKNGKVEANGYLDKLIKDTTVKNQIKNFALRQVVGQQGWRAGKEELKTMIVGDKENTGAMNKYYRNFVYDLYSQVDRATGQVYSEKLGFEFYIYEGGLIETSRKFCKEKNGQVFHKSEIETWDPKVAKPPGYNPFTDCGGYGCRHHLNGIPNSLALVLRPDAISFIQKQEIPIKEKIEGVADATAQELKKTGRPDNTIYRDFEGMNRGETTARMKTTEQLKEEFGRPISTQLLYGKPNKNLPSEGAEKMDRRDIMLKKWETTKPKELNIEDLEFPQQFVFEKPLIKNNGTQDILAVEYGGRNYIMDGNHTVAKNFLGGSTKVKVKVIKL